ncbi:MAG: hypothetical protein FD155_1563 [Bacteroidetes bacterium]|nr:MAG: hypothetical protein FD155_1563 [Bacteroidota bacterium]
MKVSRFKISLLFFYLVLVFQTTSFAQETDTTGRYLTEKITAQIESITESLDANLDFSDLVESYYYHAENKININGPDADELRNLYLISDFQLQSLKNYLKKFGPLISIYELPLIEGFDDQTVELLTPIIDVSSQSTSGRLKPKQIAKWGRHQIITRMERNLNEQIGYQPTDDSSLWEKPNSRYLGSKEKIYAKYGFNYRNRVRAGVTMDKDAGEVFFKQNVNDSLQSLVGSKLKNGFDFLSAHAFIADVGIVKAVALGDYHLSFGQGITMWSGLSHGKSTVPTQVMRYGRGLKPNSSVNESYFLRGGAATLGWKAFELTVFYSNKKIDANAESADTLSNDDYYVTSLQESGLHRTVSELSDKGTLSQQLYGGRFAYRSKKFEIGYTMHQTMLGTTLFPRTYPYSQFRFQSDRLMNQGIDWRWVNPHVIFFGELGMSDNGAMAGIAGLATQPAGFVSLTLAYRHYEKEYQNLFSNAFSESSSTANESGIYAGISASLAPGWKVSAYADQFKFQWLRFSTDAPSNGFDYFVQSDYRISRKADLYVRFRTKQKMINDNNPWNAIDFIIPETKNSYRFHINYTVSPSITFKNRAELISYKKGNEENDYGFIIYQDIIYRPENKPFELNFRYAVFDADSYDARLYAYESDVLYAFSIPAFSEKGSRAYLLFKLKAFKNVDFWARVAHTWYDNRSEIGSGLDVIEGNSKTDLKIQVRWKF